jgi:hypothetical protein
MSCVVVIGICTGVLIRVLFRNMQIKSRIFSNTLADKFDFSSYLQFARKLFSVVGAEWLPFFGEQDREDCFDIFFVGQLSMNTNHLQPSEIPCIRVAALTALAAALGWCQDAFTLQHVVRLLKVSPP